MKRHWWLVVLPGLLGLAAAALFKVRADPGPSVYARADIYLNSWRLDTQPVSILEAFACGLPVVSTAVGGIPYMTRHGEDAMLAPNEDAAQLAEHMVTLLRDDALCARLIRQARSRIQDHSWAPIYSKLLGLYHDESPT